MKKIFNLLVILIIIKNYYCRISLASEKLLLEDSIYKQVFNQMKLNKWIDAENLAIKLGNKALLKIVLSQAFLDPKYTKNSFYKITNFLKANPKWPQNSLLKSKAENFVDNKVSIKEIYSWFKVHNPKTGFGHKHYAFAAAHHSTPELNKKLTTIIKNAWIYGHFNNKQQLSFYKRFKNFLNQKDHIKRIDKLIWEGATHLAKSSFNLVDKGYQNSFKAHIAFLKDKKKAEQLFITISSKYYTPGLIFEYINSQKNDLPNSNKIINLIKLIKSYELYGDNFWKIQSYLAREYIREKRFKDAYIIASTNFAKKIENISDSEFMSGWLALRFLKKPQVAVQHFKRFSQIVKNPISLSRGLYWLGRAYFINGEKEEAKRLYRRAGNEFSYTFYGQMSILELGETLLRLPPKTILNCKRNFHIENNDVLEATKIVIRYGDSNLCKTYLENLINFAKEKEEILAITWAMNLGKIHHKVWLSRKAIQKRVFLENYSFPHPYKIKHLPAENALIYSIVRQESSFEKSVIAPDQGMGLMQLMEKTARDVAKKLALEFIPRNLTHDPNYNLTLGSHYLADMLKQHDNHYVLAIAAYNAGPYQVRKWLDLYGNLKSFKSYYQVIDWIESIPFAVTRNYVQRVLENLQIYRAILNNTPRFYLKQDLLGIQMF